MAFIAGDRARQLIAAGRPEAEARAAGQLEAHYYMTRAARFGGKLGTAEELYRREGAQVRGEGQPPPPAAPPPGGAIEAPAAAAPVPAPAAVPATAAGVSETAAPAVARETPLPRGYEKWTNGATVDLGNEGQIKGFTVLGREGEKFILKKGRRTYEFEPPPLKLKEKTGFEVLEYLHEIKGAEEPAAAAAPTDPVGVARQALDAFTAKVKAEHTGDPIQQLIARNSPEGKALDAAYQKALLEKQQAEPPAIGHNQPPEETTAAVPAPVAEAAAPAKPAEPEGPLHSLDFAIQEEIAKGEAAHAAENTRRQEAGEKPLKRKRPGQRKDEARLAMIEKEVGPEMRAAQEMYGFDENQMYAIRKLYRRESAEHPHKALERAFDEFSAQEVREVLDTITPSPEMQHDARVFLEHMDAEAERARPGFWYTGVGSGTIGEVGSTARPGVERYIPATERSTLRGRLIEPELPEAPFEHEFHQSADTGGHPVEGGRSPAEAPGEAATGGEGAARVGGHEGERGALAEEAGAEGKPQTLIPGVEPVSARERLEAEMNKPLAGGEKPPPEGGLFDEDARNQQSLFQQHLGAIIVRRGGLPSLITLMKDANSSTFIHEIGHDFFHQLARDALHPDAPAQLKQDAAAARRWAGASETGPISRRAHEKFAKGFEQYLREGTAPSEGLAHIFRQFKDWLTSIYQTIKGLGAPINEDIRGVFDRLLAEEPRRTVIADEKAAAGPTMADIHEVDATHTEPQEAPQVADRVAAERVTATTEPPPQVRNEIQAAESRQAEQAVEQGGEAGGEGRADAGGENGAGAAGSGEVGSDSGRSGAVAGGGDVGAGNTKVGGGGSEAAAEGAGVPGPEQRRGTSATDEPPLAPAPAPIFGAGESPYVDKAGNIRLENLTDVESARQAMHDMADAHDDFIGDRHGVVTDGQVMDLARAAGMEGLDEVVRKRLADQSMRAVEATMLRLGLVQAEAASSAAAKKAALPNATAEDVIEYAMAKDRHRVLQGLVSRETADAGRTLRAFRDIKAVTDVDADVALRESTGKTLFQMRQEAKFAAQLEPGQLAKYMNDSHKHTFGRMILEFWVNNLISGPATHSTYMVGNTILAMQKMGPETMAAAAIGSVRRRLGREGEVVHMGETGAGIGGMLRGVAPATKAAIESVRTGVTALLPGETGGAMNVLGPGTAMAAAPRADMGADFHDVAGSAFGIVRGARDAIHAGAELVQMGGIEGAPLLGTEYSPLGQIPNIQIKGQTVLPLGSVIRAPGRMIAAIHSFTRVMNYSIDINQRAYRAAAEAGLTGEAFNQRVATLRQDPSNHMMEGARREATELALMGQAGKFTQGLSRILNTEFNVPLLGATPLLKFIDPFVHISSNVISESIIKRTPMGMFSGELRADLMGRNGNIASDKAWARMAVGTAFATAIGSLAAEGFATGSGPANPEEAAMWRLAGNQAHSVRVGDMWYSSQRLGPMGMLVGIGADLFDVVHAAGKGEFSEAAGHFLHAVVRNILDESFMRGPSDLIKAVEDPGRYGASYVRDQLASFVPFSVGLAQESRAMDPYSREARSVVDAIKNKIPGLSEDLVARRNIWGEPIPNRSALVGAGVSAIYMQHVNNDPVNQALMTLNIFPAQVDRKIRNVELTQQQHDEYARVAGHMSKMRLDRIINSPDWQRMPPEAQHNVIQEVIRQNREAARGMIMAKDPTIIQRAQQQKMATMRGEPKHH